MTTVRWDAQGGEGLPPSLGGGYTQNGGDNVDIGEDEDVGEEGEGKIDNGQSKVHKLSCGHVATRPV